MYSTVSGSWCADMLCIALTVGFENCSQIQELMLYKLELDHNVIEATKNI